MDDSIALELAGVVVAGFAEAFVVFEDPVELGVVELEHERADDLASSIERGWR